MSTRWDKFLRQFHDITYDEWTDYAREDISMTKDTYMPKKEVEKAIAGYAGIHGVSVHCDINPTPQPTIKDVIFSPPATIVFWSDNTKTVVKADDEPYDPEKGIAMAISKKMLGDNKYEYYNIFKHWLKKWNKQENTRKENE